jgi:hypothetical protein
MLHAVLLLGLLDAACCCCGGGGGEARLAAAWRSLRGPAAAPRAQRTHAPSSAPSCCIVGSTGDAGALGTAARRRRGAGEAAGSPRHLTGACLEQAAAMGMSRARTAALLQI